MRSRFWDIYLYSLVPLVVLTIFLSSFELLDTNEVFNYFMGLVLLIFLILGFIFYVRTIISLFNEGRNGVGIALIFLILFYGVGFIIAVYTYFSYPKVKEKNEKKK